jgi:hypothetical protein
MGEASGSSPLWSTEIKAGKCRTLISVGCSAKLLRHSLVGRRGLGREATAKLLRHI